jgi:hypothetical protein
LLRIVGQSLVKNGDTSELAPIAWVTNPHQAHLLATTTIPLMGHSP